MLLNKSADIRKLLKETFTDLELVEISADYFPEVYSKFTETMSREWKIHFLLDYCNRQNQIGYLLDIIKEYYPSRYEQFINKTEEPDGGYVEILLNGEFPHLTSDNLDTARGVMSELLKIPREQISVKSAERGSLKLELGLPAEAVSKLISLYETMDPSIQEVGIEEVRLVYGGESYPASYKPKDRPTGLGWIILLYCLIIALVGTLLKQFSLLPFGSIRGYEWGFFAFIAFLVGLGRYAATLLPVPGWMGWNEALRLLLTFSFGILKRRHVRRPKPGPDTYLLAGLPEGIHAFGSGMVDSHLTLIVEKGIRFSRTAGPGFISLRNFEKVVDAIDLRNHSQRIYVKSITRDGIPVETPIQLLFRLKRESGDLHGIPYPYDEEAAKSLAYADSTNRDDVQVAWFEQVGRQIGIISSRYFSRYTFDELFVESEEYAPVQERFTEVVRREATKTFSHLGLDILRVEMGQLVLPDEVIAQRIEQWQAKWQRRIQTQLSSVENEAERRLKSGRARSQVRMIAEIGDAIRELRRSESSNVIELAALRMAEALEATVTGQEESEKAEIQELLLRMLLSQISNVSELKRPESYRGNQLS